MHPSQRSFSRRGFIEQLAALGLGGVMGEQTLRAAEPPVAPTADEWILQQLDQPQRLRFAGNTAAEARAWQQEFSLVLRKALGDFRPPAVWRETLEQRVELDDHVREEWILTADGLAPLPAAVLIPKQTASGKRAGVLALHGHGPRGYLAIADGESGRHLVAQGYVVAVPCFMPFGRRLGPKESWGKSDPCGITYLRLQLLGRLLIAENLRDALWTLEWLARRGDVDPKRLGCVGLSYGGRMAMLAAAVEERIRVVNVSGALNVMQERIRGHYSCGAQVIPGLLQYGDTPEIGALIAPRRAVWSAGVKDTLLPSPWREDAYARIERVYQALGAPQQLQLDRHEGGHEWSWPLVDMALRDVLAMDRQQTP